MSLQQVQMWRVVCDSRDCTKSPQDDSDYWSWAEQETATAEAESDGWLVTDDGKHYCLDHWKWTDDGEEQIPLLAVPSGEETSRP